MANKTPEQRQDVRRGRYKMGAGPSTQTVTNNGPDDFGMVSATFGAYFISGDYSGSSRRIKEAQDWLELHCEQIYGPITINITIGKG